MDTDTNKSSKLVDELESGNFFNEIIENCREMDNLLLESDFALQTAESELNATIKKKSSITSEDESSVLSIEVSDDLFKGHISDIHFSPIRYKADIEEQTQPVLSDNLNNLLDEFNSSLKNFNESFKINSSTENIDDADKTVVQEMSDTENESINKMVTIKSFLLDSEEEHDYIYVDMYKTLEITVPNSKENLSVPDKKTKLNNSNYFEGCSHDFNSTVNNDYTVIINNDLNLTGNKSSLVKYSTKKLNSSSNTPNIETVVSECTESSIENNNFKSLLNNNEQTIQVIIHCNQEVVQKSCDTNNFINATQNQAEEFTLNENNNIITHVKRPLEDDSTAIENPKKIKLDEDLITIDKTTSKSDEVINDDEHVSLNNDFNFTQVIFDPQETADHNDPKWSILKELETNEDYFNSVRTQWHTLSLPNPHKSNTTRYVPESIAKIKPETETSAENNQAITVHQYLENRLNYLNKEINHLNSKLNSTLRYRSNKERKQIYQQLEELRHLRHEVEKNQEEVKHINMFYCNDSQGWNANYLTRSQLCDLQEQDKILEFQKKFYKS